VVSQINAQVSALENTDLTLSDAMCPTLAKDELAMVRDAIQSDALATAFGASLSTAPESWLCPGNVFNSAAGIAALNTSAYNSYISALENFDGLFAPGSLLSNLNAGNVAF
jgi:hypothetical protein